MAGLMILPVVTVSNPPVHGRRYQSGYDDGFKAGKWAGRRDVPRLVLELRDALEQAGWSLDNADIPWPWDKSLSVRADAALAEEAKAGEGEKC